MAHGENETMAKWNEDDVKKIPAYLSDRPIISHPK
jgi:hypothetical protein